MDRAAAPASPAGTITVDGSGLLEPLSRLWAGAYHTAHPATKVSVGGGGSTVGIADAATGKVEIGTSDAYLSSGDVLVHPGLLNIPLAVSAQSVIYNLPSVPRGEHVKLTPTLLADMYDGTITKWNDPAIVAENPGIPLPALKVVPVHRKFGSGDTFIFTQYLSNGDAGWSKAVGYGTVVSWPAISAAVALSGSATAITGCVVGCVGYNGVSYLRQAEARGLGEAELLNGGGQYALPTPQAITDEVSSFIAITPPNETIALIAAHSATGYPIVNYEYAIVRTHQQDAATASELRDFLDWAVRQGNAQAFTGQVGFQPLPADTATLSLDQIARIR